MDHLLTEARNPASANLDVLSPIEIVRLMNAEDAKVAPAVASEASSIAQAVEVIAARIQAGGRLVYVGAGTSGRLGVLDASECPPTFNSPPGQIVGIIAGGYQALTTAVEGAEDHPEFGETDLQAIALSNKDVLVGIATSGRTPYVIGALRYARSIGAYAIGLACVPNSGLAPEADLMITPIVGPEVLTGSTRLKAGTATKLVLNMLTTGAMVRMGKTFGNLMVDLRATNEKLKARTNRIVRHLLGVGVDEAAALLEKAGGELKTAIVIGKTGLSPLEARERLRTTGGQVAEVLTHDRKEAHSFPRHLLGIDGGGTHTVAMLAVSDGDGIRIVGRGEAGPSNMKSVGPASAFAEIDRAVGESFTSAGLRPGPVGVACLGLAGAGRAEDQSEVRTWATRLGLASRIDVVPDVALPVALLPGGAGISVVAGTGSSVWGRAPDGRTARAGGWGSLLGDEGSGYALVIAALRIIARSADRRTRATLLTDRLLTAMGLTEPPQLVSAVHGGLWERSRLSTLAPEVIGAAADGDPLAEELVANQLSDLASCVDSVATTLGLSRDGLSIALAGGLFLNSPFYQKRFQQALEASGIHVGQLLAVSEPAQGALRLAIRELPSQVHV